MIAISTSGNSPNLLKAIPFANHKNAITVGHTSFDGGKLIDLTDFSVHVP
jgi:D-sedoheptulose 7-phosphate isomerase